MEPLAFAPEQDLVWRPIPNERGYFELCSGNVRYADLRRQQLQTLATTQATQWSFQAKGFFRPQVVIHDERQHTENGFFSWRQQTLTLETARQRYRWQAADATMDEQAAAWLTETGVPVLQFVAADLHQSLVRVILAPAAADASAVPLLATLGWHIYLANVAA